MALVARDLKVARGGFDLDVPSLAADVRGLALVGRNGAGKTTLLLALQGLVAYSGSVERPARCAGVFSQPAFLRGSALWNVEIAARRADSAREFLDLVGLGDAAGEKAGHLSSGQRQRLALARALAVEPDILFLDEAFANVDADARVALRGVVRDRARGAGCAVVVATQSYADVVALSERVVLLDRGRVQADIPADQIGSNSSSYLQAMIQEAERVRALY